MMTACSAVQRDRNIGQQCYAAAAAAAGDDDDDDASI